MKNNKNILIIGAIIVAALFLFKGNVFTASITGNEVMTRTVPTINITPGSTFSVSYTVSGASGSWGATIQDAVTNGCLFPAGTSSYRTVMLSEDGLVKTITMTAPNVNADCVFSGDYQFGTFPVVNLPTQTVRIRQCIPSCVRPSDLCVEASTVPNGCGGYCTGQWQVTRLTAADLDCNNVISRSELGSGITWWTGGTFSRSDLGICIQSWAST